MQKTLSPTVDDVGPLSAIWPASHKKNKKNKKADQANLIDFSLLMNMSKYCCC